MRLVSWSGVGFDCGVSPLRLNLGELGLIVGALGD